ncbi:MAG TPA: hypothetical protein VE991_02005 [Acidimicrobiales bacterium]|nr:hypothetical protein [Acidimicrobiales bacterium]
MTHRRRRAEESGQALVLVLVFLVIFSVVIGLLLTQSQSTFVLNESTQSQSRMMYAADAGIEWAIGQIAANSNTCPASFQTPNSTTAGISVPLPGINSVTVQCVPATGPGSNLYNGYAVITGMGYPSTGGGGSSTCTSFSSDGIGGGTATWMSGTAACPTYKVPGGSNPTPIWTNLKAASQSSPLPAELNAVSGVDPDDVYSVGNAANGAEGIWMFDEDGNFTQLATASNTAGIKNANLFGLYAPDVNHVWTAGQNGDIFYCTGSCSDQTSSWAKQTTPNTTQINYLFGNSTSQIFAVGNANGGSGTVWSYNSLLSTWVALGLTPPSTTKNLLGVYATDATDVWVVGQSGTIFYYNGLTWVQQTAPGGTPDLYAIDGTDSAHLWAVGDNFTITCTSLCTSPQATWVKVTNGGVGHAQAVVAADAGDVWIGGNNAMSYCSAATCNAANSTFTAYTSSQLPSGLGQITDMNSVAQGPSGGWSGNVWAVDNKGNALVYTPLTTTGTVKAKISGGPVFNAQGAVFTSPVQVVGNTFTQQVTGAQQTCVGTTPPSGLTADAGYCTTPAIPAALTTLDRPFPTQYPSAGGIAYSGTPVSGCNLVVYKPGAYTSGISFSKNTTYFFESGLYYMGGGFGAFDNGSTGTDNLYVIGGEPSQGDVPFLFQNSPCYNYLTNTTSAGYSLYYHLPANGTGVEWILGNGTWMDVHTVNLELFTRQGGAAWEGSQGLSLREVPAACGNGVSPGYGPSCLTSALQTLGYKPSSVGGPGQIFQVDANNHLPQVFVHGGLYTPTHNIEEFSNNEGVILGPIDCWSLELSYQSSTSPTLNIEAGTGLPQFEIKATANGSGAPFEEDAVWGQQTQGGAMSLLNWWVVRR